MNSYLVEKPSIDDFMGKFRPILDIKKAPPEDRLSVF